MVDTMKVDVRFIGNARITARDAGSDISVTDAALENVSEGTAASDACTVGQSNAGGSETVTTATGTNALAYSVYETNIISGGDGTQDVTIPAGTIVGQRRLITFGTETIGSDLVDFDPFSNMVGLAGATLTALSLDDVDDFVLFEWNGLKWQVVYQAGTHTTS